MPPTVPALPATAEKVCPGPICQGAPRDRLLFRTHAKCCRRCEHVLYTATPHKRGTPHRRLRIPTICGACHQPERLLGNDGKPRPLIAYLDAGTRQLVGWLCSECERMLVAANHQIQRLAQGIIFLSGGGSVPAVVDVVSN